jgi:hypothetical protein
MTEANKTPWVFAFTDHFPLTPYHCLFAFYTSRALSASLTSIF